MDRILRASAHVLYEYVDFVLAAVLLFFCSGKIIIIIIIIIPGYQVSDTFGIRLLGAQRACCALLSTWYGVLVLGTGDLWN